MNFGKKLPVKIFKDDTNARHTLALIGDINKNIIANIHFQCENLKMDFFKEPHFN